MRRIAIAMRTKPRLKEEFKHRCTHLWDRFLAPLNLQHIKNFSVWNVEDLVFCYAEDYSDIQSEEGEQSFIPRLVKYFDCCDCLASPVNNPMKLMYEDIGIVREDKSLIRHRVFVTRLKPGCADEYKQRHDALVEARGDKVNPGPESNFTIWNTGDYIFGYCEIVKAMEKPVEETREASRDWETRQLEIMDWITDDVDWLTGQKHEKIQQLFWKIDLKYC